MFYVLILCADAFVVIQGIIRWQRYATFLKISNDFFLFLAYFIPGSFGEDLLLRFLIFKDENCVAKRELTFKGDPTFIGVLLSREYGL